MDGREFESWDEFNHFIKEYEEQKKLIYTIKDCRSVLAANKRLPVEDHPYENI